MIGLFSGFHGVLSDRADHPGYAPAEQRGESGGEEGDGCPGVRFLFPSETLLLLLLADLPRLKETALHNDCELISSLSVCLSVSIPDPTMQAITSDVLFGSSRPSTSLFTPFLSLYLFLHPITTYTNIVSCPVRPAVMTPSCSPATPTASDRTGSSRLEVSQRRASCSVYRE
jgi:hypothetical protein